MIRAAWRSRRTYNIGWFAAVRLEIAVRRLTRAYDEMNKEVAA